MLSFNADDTYRIGIRLECLKLAVAMSPGYRDAQLDAPRIADDLVRWVHSGTDGAGGSGVLVSGGVGQPAGKPSPEFDRVVPRPDGWMPEREFVAWFVSEPVDSLAVQNAIDRYRKHKIASSPDRNRDPDDPWAKGRPDVTPA